MFADNLVPHVLRLDGILVFDPELVGRIERDELIEPDSPEEIEIRAGAVHAVELIVAATARALARGRRRSAAVGAWPAALATRPRPGTAAGAPRY